MSDENNCKCSVTQIDLSLETIVGLEYLISSDLCMFFDPDLATSAYNLNNIEEPIETILSATKETVSDPCSLEILNTTSVRYRIPAEPTFVDSFYYRAGKIFSLVSLNLISKENVSSLKSKEELESINSKEFAIPYPPSNIDELFYRVGATLANAKISMAIENQMNTEALRIYKKYSEDEISSLPEHEQVLWKHGRDYEKKMITGE